MPETIMEKYSWMSPEFKLVDSGKNTIRIKGVALKGNAVSRNKRKYVDEELKKAARTWIGKPVTINHDSTKKVGNVVWMEYEDGALEYLADIKREPYVGLLRNKSADIRGVSIEANYLHNRCPQCGKKFYTEEDFAEHMWTQHFVRTDPLKEPHGILGQALSLVLAPEEPGFPDSTIELQETYEKPVLQLLETVIKTKKEEEKYLKTIKERAVVTPKQRRTWDKKPEIKEQQPRTDAERAKAHFNISDVEWEKLSDEKKQEYISKLPERGSAKEQQEPCPEGEHRNEEGECVPDKVEEQEEPCPTGQHRDEAGNCVPDEQLAIEPPVAEQEMPMPTPEPEKHVCPAGWHWDDSEGGCVEDEVATAEPTNVVVSEQEATSIDTPPLFPIPEETPDCGPNAHYDKEAGVCVPDALPTEAQEPVEPPKTFEIHLPTMLKLGEPFADYKDFADCVAKNQEKEDPEAYCATIKRKVEGETVAKIKESTNIYESIQALASNVKKLDYTAYKRDTQLAESVNKLNNATAQVVSLVKQEAKKFKALETQSSTESKLRARYDKTIHKKIMEELGKINKALTSIQEHDRKAHGKLATEIGKNTASMTQQKKYVEEIKTVVAKNTASTTQQKKHLDAVKTVVETTQASLAKHEKSLEEVKNLATETKELASSQKKDFENILAEADKNALERGKQIKSLEEWKALKEQEDAEKPEPCPEGQHRDEEGKCVPDEEKPDEVKELKETMAKLMVKVENFEEKRKGEFKGHKKTLKDKADEPSEDPRRRK